MKNRFRTMKNYTVLKQRLRNVEILSSFRTMKNYTVIKQAVGSSPTKAGFRGI